MSRTLVGVFALFLVFTLGGCEDSAGVGDSGTLSIFLTDNPDFLMAKVNITRVELAGGGGEDGEGGGSVVLWEGSESPDLLTLANEVALLVDKATVPDGTYTQLRVIIPQACIAVGEDEVVTEVYASPDYPDCNPLEPDPGIFMGDLQLPSFEQTGIKVNLPNGGLKVSGDQQILLLDFNVPESFAHEAGNSEKWVMHPVIKAEDMSLSGSITVGLTLGGDGSLPGGVSPVDYFQATLDDGSETESAAFTGPDAGGKYAASFLFLDPDADYDVSVAPKDGKSIDGFQVDPSWTQTVSLSSGQSVTVSFEVTAPSTS